MGVKMCCGDTRNQNENMDNFNENNIVEENNQPAVPTVLSHLEVNEGLVSDSIINTYKSKEGDIIIDDKRVSIYNLASEQFK